jgi:hypothetical protein
MTTYNAIQSKLSGNVIDIQGASTKSGALFAPYPLQGKGVRGTIMAKGEQVMRYVNRLNVLCGIAVVATMVLSGAPTCAATRTLWGAINASGSIKSSGGGFTVIHSGTGQYVLSFSPTFSDTPAVVGSQTNLGCLCEDPRDNVAFPFVSNGAATVVTGDSGGNQVDRNFSFIAIGEEKQ